MFLASGVSGQYFQGQFYTNGLSIISAPQPGSTEHAGSTLSIAISLSGQGNLTALDPGASSSFGAGYDHLALFLVSASQNLNLSVSDGLLGQESGSNVKHVNYQVPSCLPSGSYNLTLYEQSRFSDEAIFAITQLPLNIENNQPSGACSGSEQLYAQPQPTSPLSASPWLQGIHSVQHVAEGLVAVFASTNPNLNIANAPPPSSPDPSLPAPTPEPTSVNPSQTASTSPSATDSEYTTSVTVTTTQVTTFSASESDQMITKTVTVTTVMATITHDPGDSNGVLFPISASSSIGPSFSIFGFALSVVLLLL